MKGMKGLCVTVDVDLEDLPDRELEKIGVYGYVTDKGTGESVLANNPDLSTDAGQFAMIPVINKTDKKTQFEFIAAVPREMVRYDFWKQLVLADSLKTAKPEEIEQVRISEEDLKKALLSTRPSLLTEDFSALNEIYNSFKGQKGSSQVQGNVNKQLKTTLK